eukprot:15475712-Alexandrium_andersonii.AAC.1
MILRNTGLKFPGGLPMSLEVWRTTPDDDCPFARDPPPSRPMTRTSATREARSAPSLSPGSGGTP